MARPAGRPATTTPRLPRSRPAHWSPNIAWPKRAPAQSAPRSNSRPPAPANTHVISCQLTHHPAAQEGLRPFLVDHIPHRRLTGTQPGLRPRHRRPGRCKLLGRVKDHPWPIRQGSSGARHGCLADDAAEHLVAVLAGSIEVALGLITHHPTASSSGPSRPQHRPRPPAGLLAIGGCIPVRQR